MKTSMMPVENVARERVAQVDALTAELALFLNQKRPDQALVLLALLNTYLVAAHSFGMLEEALPMMAANAVAKAKEHGISLDVSISTSLH